MGRPTKEHRSPLLLAGAPSRLVLALTTSGLALLGVMGLAAWVVRDARLAARWVEHTHRVIEHVAAPARPSADPGESPDLPPGRGFSLPGGVPRDGWRGGSAALIRDFDAYEHGLLTGRAQRVDRSERLQVLTVVAALLMAAGFAAWAVRLPSREARTIAASEARYRLLAENTSDLVSRQALDSTFEYASPSHAAALGWTPEELLGQRAVDLLDPEDAGRVVAAMAATQSGDPPRPIEGRMRHKAGHYISIEFLLTPIAGPHGAPVGILASGRDITARRELEEQLRQSRKMEALGRMAGGVAHDCNNLLTVIRSCTELARGSAPPGSLLDGDFADITAAVDRGASLTTQLLAFSRRQHTATALVSVASLVRCNESLLRRLVLPPRSGLDLDLGWNRPRSTPIPRSSNRSSTIWW